PAYSALGSLRGGDGNCRVLDRDRRGGWVRGAGRLARWTRRDAVAGIRARGARLGVSVRAARRRGGGAPVDAPLARSRRSGGIRGGPGARLLSPASLTGPGPSTV